MPPVGPSGSRSSSVALKASVLPTLRTLRPKIPHSAGFIVAGPVLSIVSSGVLGGSGGRMNSPTRPELFVVPPSSVMYSFTGWPLTRKFMSSVYSMPSTTKVVGAGEATMVTRSVHPVPWVGYGQGSRSFGVSSWLNVNVKVIGGLGTPSTASTRVTSS